MYVEKVDVHPDLDAYLATRRLSVIDIEIDLIQAEQITAHLMEMSAAGIVGSIRLRFTGRLMHL